MNVLKSIKSWFNAINRWFVNLMSVNDRFVRTCAPAAIEAVNIIKRANDDGVINFMGSFVSALGARWGSPVAQKISTWLTNNVDYMLNMLDITEQAAGCSTIDEKLLIVSRAISTDFPEIREQFCTAFAADLARYLADGHLSFAEAVTLITGVYKAYYSHHKTSAE